MSCLCMSAAVLIGLRGDWQRFTMASMEDEEECSRCSLCGQDFGATDKVTRLVWQLAELKGAVDRPSTVQCRQIRHDMTLAVPHLTSGLCVVSSLLSVFRSMEHLLRIALRATPLEVGASKKGSSICAQCFYSMRGSFPEREAGWHEGCHGESCIRQWEVPCFLHCSNCSSVFFNLHMWRLFFVAFMTLRLMTLWLLMHSMHSFFLKVKVGRQMHFNKICFIQCHDQRYQRKISRPRPRE